MKLKSRSTRVTFGGGGGRCEILLGGVDEATSESRKEDVRVPLRAVISNADGYTKSSLLNTLVGLWRNKKEKKENDNNKEKTDAGESNNRRTSG